MTEKLRLIFVNPPGRWYEFSPPLTYINMISYYNHHGKYPHEVIWLDPPYKWDTYNSIEEAYQDCEPADVYLISSYVWNYDFCDDFVRYAKSVNPKAIFIIGGPHIGTNDKDLLSIRTKLYDYILKPTQPGEIFLCDFLDNYLENRSLPSYDSLSWELRSSKTCNQFMQNYSVYEENQSMLQRMQDYALPRNIRFNISFESTRGCPFKCNFCEWGGGIGSTKIIKKPMEIIKKDIEILSKLKFTAIELCDANFGAFRERDLEMYKTALDHGIFFVGIAIVKLTDYERKKKIIDSCIDIVANSEIYKTDPSLKTWDIIPTVGVQSTSDAAVKATNRVDLRVEDKIKLAKHVNDRMKNLDIPDVFSDFMLGLPESTVNDFYNDYEIIWNQRSFSSHRYTYMILPDTENSHPDYLKKHGITLVKVYSNFFNNQRPNPPLLYKNRGYIYYTIAESNTLSRTDMCQIWIMNLIGNRILEKIYPKYVDQISAPDFMRLSWGAVQQLPLFGAMWDEATDLFDPTTPPRNSEQLFDQDPLNLSHRIMENHGTEIESYLEKKIAAREVNK